MVYQLVVFLELYPGQAGWNFVLGNLASPVSGHMREGPKSGPEHIYICEHKLYCIITCRGNFTLNFSRMNREARSAITVFQVTFNVEFTSQVMNFPWIASSVLNDLNQILFFRILPSSQKLQARVFPCKRTEEPRYLPCLLMIYSLSSVLRCILQRMVITLVYLCIVYIVLSFFFFSFLFFLFLSPPIESLYVQVSSARLDLLSYLRAGEAAMYIRENK